MMKKIEIFLIASLSIFTMTASLYVVALEHLESKTKEALIITQGDTKKAKVLLNESIITKAEIEISSNIDKHIFKRNIVAIDYYLNSENEIVAKIENTLALNKNK